MVLYSDMSDMFQYNSANGMTDLTNVDIVLGLGDLVNMPALVAKYVSIRSANTSPRMFGTYRIHQTTEPVVSSNQTFHQDQIHLDLGKIEHTIPRLTENLLT
jgi:hypothetical protein